MDSGPTFYVAPPPLGDDGNPGTNDAPFATLDRARLAVRSINASMNDDITVYLHAGTYDLSQTVSFDAGDSGQNGHQVFYAAYPGETPIISGGQQITGWVPYQNGIYKAPANGLLFRQLYVNGARAVRARSPNQGSYYQMQGWIIPSQKPDGQPTSAIAGAILQPDGLNQICNPSGVEVHALIGPTDSEFRIRSFSINDAYTATVVPMDPEASNLTALPHWAWMADFYYLENALEFLDSPGEWYLKTDTSEVFYMPRVGEDLASAEVIAPAVETLIHRTFIFSDSLLSTRPGYYQVLRGVFPVFGQAWRVVLLIPP
jgi:hypothetical protein